MKNPRLVKQLAEGLSVFISLSWIWQRGSNRADRFGQGEEVGTRTLSLFLSVLTLAPGPQHGDAAGLPR